MVEYVVICTVALLASTLSLISGFGLGTVLMPAFAVFFPVGIAVAATAVVHLATNLFKVALVGRYASREIAIRFAVPAVAFSAVGALLLGYLTDMEPIVRYELGGHYCEITFAKTVIAALIAAFSILDLSPRFENLAFPKRYAMFGGAASGFLGGISGLQGALRSAFLVRFGLDKEAFVGTAVIAAVAVDISRLVIYGGTILSTRYAALAEAGVPGLVVAGMITAFVGSLIGVRFLSQVTLRSVRMVVGVMLLLLSLALGTGVL